MKNWRDTVFYGMTLTAEQMDYMESMEKNRLTIVESVSGSGKTTLPVAYAHITGKELLYLFAPVQERAMGHRPGTQGAKDRAYIGPLLDALETIREDSAKAIKPDLEDLTAGWPSMANAQKRGGPQPWVEACSHIFLRGTNIGKDGNLVVVIDEAQNWTRQELRKTLSRIHDAATVVVAGHLGQIDLPNPANSGFQRVIDVFADKSYAKKITLTKNFRGELSRDADTI